MTLSRRLFIASLAAAAAVPPAFADDEIPSPDLSQEPFPVKDDENKIEYKYRRRQMAYNTSEAPGTIIVDPKARFLYYVVGNGQAIRYGVSVGKQGRTWSGAATIGRMEKWPTWTPTPEHLAEFPKLAKYIPGGMPGGLDNPMGARALYLFQGDVDTVYRIHGTYDPSFIGRKKTAGCVSLLNVDIIDLFNRVQMGTKVVVLEY
jgi:lipoprotein-anchoring transpeptidase ErfK/SrfK